MTSAAEILHNPELLEAFVAGSTWDRDNVIRTLTATAEKKAAEAESAKQRAYAEYPALLKRAREERDRARRELANAAKALRHCCTLFHTIKSLVCDEEFDLAEIGEDQAGFAAERAQDEADYFAETAQ
ncbi:hypothetical protein [Paraburkholderia sp. SIMBA_027]|uniref:hypothetical protein n=1 Tax=Paraburkholderia sp. SIMBA_027 TaxID=3085770 RepID=UPI00397E1052